MKQAMKKWLNQHQITFDPNTANSICNRFGLDGEKADECLGLCYQLESDKITQAEFTGGLCVLTGKEPEEVMGVLRDIKGQQETFDDFVTSTLSKLSTKYNLPPPKWQVIRSEKAYYDWDKKLLEIPQFLRDAWPEAKAPLVSYLRHEFCHYRQDMEGRGNLPEHELETECFKFEAGDDHEEIKVQIKPFFGRTDVSGGGSFTLYKGDKEIGHAAVAFHHRDITYPISGFVPAKTAVLDTMEINEEERGKGYGGKFIDEIEKVAKEQGMETIHLISVMGESVEFWRKKGYQFSGHKRIWIKELESGPKKD